MKLKKVKSIEQLSENLKSPNILVRLRAARALGKIKDARAVEPLILALRDKSRFVRKSVVKALKRIDLYAVEPLIMALENTNEDSRRFVVKVLGRIGDTRAVEPLIRALGDKKWSIRVSAAEALGEIGDVRSVEPLIQILKDRYRPVRVSAANALGQIGEVQTEESLIQILTDAVEPLIRILTGNDRSSVKASAAGALGRIGDARAIEPLIQVLGRKNWFVQRAASRALIRIGTPAIEPLIRAAQAQTLLARKRIMRTLSEVCAPIDTILFGTEVSGEMNQRNMWLNPDVSELTIPLSKLEKIVLDSETYDFHLVERFITYAVNHIGQKRLKEYVNVYIFGISDILHPNLYNALNNLCKRVECIDGGV